MRIRFFYPLCTSALLMTGCSTSRDLPYSFAEVRAKLSAFEPTNGSESYGKSVLRDTKTTYQIKVIMPYLLSYGRSLIKVQPAGDALTKATVSSAMRTAPPFSLLTPQELFHTDTAEESKILDALEEAMRSKKSLAQVCDESGIEMLKPPPPPSNTAPWEKQGAH